MAFVAGIAAVCIICIIAMSWSEVKRLFRKNKN
jgi:hypothetical protein